MRTLLQPRSVVAAQFVGFLARAAESTSDAMDRAADRARQEADELRRDD